MTGDEPDCNPCIFCQNYTCDIDWHTGYEDEGCKADEEFWNDVRPCPSFKPILPSDDLICTLV